MRGSRTEEDFGAFKFERADWVTQAHAKVTASVPSRHRAVGGGRTRGPRSRTRRIRPGSLSRLRPGCSPDRPWLADKPGRGVGGFGDMELQLPMRSGVCVCCCRGGR